MKPIVPKYLDTVKVEWAISKKAKKIISEYSKYTKYEESEIVNELIMQIIEDKEFLKWLQKRRFNKRTAWLLDYAIGVDGYEEIKEDSEIF